MESWMNDQSRMFGQLMLPGFCEFTCLQELQAEISPCSSPDGQPTSPYGLEAAPAKRSAVPAKVAALATTETYGRYLQTSSASASLQSSLASRLKQQLASGGSIEYIETWKQKITPSGVQYWAHTASTPRTSANGCTGERKGWQTPRANETSADAKPNGKPNLQGEARIAGWLTPKAQEVCEPPEQSTARLKDRAETTCLSVAAQAKYLAGWMTPAVACHGRASSPYMKNVQALAAGEKAPCQVLISDQAILAGWPTAQAADPIEGARTAPDSRQSCLGRDVPLAGWPTAQEDNANNPFGHKGTSFSDLPSTTQAAGWPTAASRDWKDTPGMATTATNPDGTERTRLDQLPRVATLTLGQMLSGGRVEMASTDGYRLNPHFSAWLMGYPVEWTSAGQKAASRLRQSKTARQCCSKATATP